MNYIGIDLGGTNVAAGVVTEKGELLGKASVPTPRGAEAVADAIALATEWKQFRLPDWNAIRKTMRGNLIVDGRNIYDQNELADKGFRYTRIGKKLAE